jgi:hypothetical protein
MQRKKRNHQYENKTVHDKTFARDHIQRNQGWHLIYATKQKKGMKKKSETVTSSSPENRKKKQVKSQRKNSTSSTRTEGRQRSGNNGPQQGSH